MKAMNSIGRENAIKLAQSKWWEECTPREIVAFQLFTAEMAMDSRVFFESIDKALGRKVSMFELGYNVEGIQAEFLGEKAAPSIEEILNLIPAEKRILVTL